MIVKSYHGVHIANALIIFRRYIILLKISQATISSLKVHLLASLTTTSSVSIPINIIHAKGPKLKTMIVNITVILLNVQNAHPATTQYVRMNFTNQTKNYTMYTVKG